MTDEGDTTMRWVCPICNEILEVDISQMPVLIRVHKIKCPASNTDNTNGYKESIIRKVKGKQQE